MLKNKLYIFKIRKKKRRLKRRRGKHLQNLFICRKKKYDLYYQKFDSKLEKKNVKGGLNVVIKNAAKTRYKLGLKSIQFNLLRSKPIKSLKYCTQRYFRSKRIGKKVFKNNLSVFPSYWLTAKPKSVRMGKGKGAHKMKIYYLKKGEDVFNIKMMKTYLNYKIKKKMYLLKLSIFIFFLMKILKTKITVKNVIYKKIY